MIRARAAGPRMEQRISVGAQIRSARPALMVSDSGMVDLRYVNIKAPQMVVEALQGGVFVGQGRNISDYAYSAQSASVFWQSQSSQSQRDETFMASQLPPMLMKAPVVRMERVRGETLAFLNQLEILTDGGDAGRIEFADLEEVHRAVSHESEGPSAALAAVISIAVVAATSGVGSGLLGSTFAGGGLPAVLAASSDAAFSSLCAGASVALVSSQGDVGAAARTLMTAPALRTILTSAVTAGATRGLTGALGLSASAGNGFGASLGYQTVQSGCARGCKACAR